MMISDRLEEALNRQIGREFGASVQYVSLATYFDSETLVELARFFYRQAEEERDHAMRIVKFVVDAGGQVRIPAIDAPRHDIGSAGEGVSLALEAEQKVTRQIYELVDIAEEDHNHIAVRFLDWFVNEQFEEVATMEALLAVVRRAGDNLLLVEEYLAREGGEVGPPEATD